MPSMVITPGAAANAYSQAAQGFPSGDKTDAFAGAIERALGGAVAAGHAADDKAARAITGGGNISDVISAVQDAELALQTTAAIRDRVVQAYQDVMKMPI